MASITYTNQVFSVISKRQERYEVYSQMARDILWRSTTKQGMQTCIWDTVPHPTGESAD